jgi:hypothetical protein
MPIKISQILSGPEPKTMGIGPMKIITPTLPDPPRNEEASKITNRPTKMNAIPKTTHLKSPLGKVNPSLSSSFGTPVLPQQQII